MGEHRLKECVRYGRGLGGLRLGKLNVAHADVPTLIGVQVWPAKDFRVGTWPACPFDGIDMQLVVDDKDQSWMRRDAGAFTHGVGAFEPDFPLSRRDPEHKSDSIKSEDTVIQQFQGRRPGQVL